MATHSALFAYDLKNLNGKPRTLYDDLAISPMLIDDRYLSIQEGAPRNVRRKAILDAQQGMRVIWSENTTGLGNSSQAGPTRQQILFFDGRERPVTVDASCNAERVQRVIRIHDLQEYEHRRARSPGATTQIRQPRAEHGFPGVHRGVRNAVAHRRTSERFFVDLAGIRYGRTT